MEDIDHVLRRFGGAATRTQLLRDVPRGRLDWLVRSGQLVSPFFRAYCRPWDADDPAVIDSAAVASVGWPSALSHGTALRRWELPVPDTTERHVLVPARRHPVDQPGLRVHRVQRFPQLVRLGGLVTVDRPDALVQGWEILSGSSRRAPLLAAARQRQLSADQVRAAMSRRTRVTDRTELLKLLHALESGCESELELWGYLHVFDVAGLRHARRQLVVTVAGERFRLDLAYEDEMLAVELDGRAYHAGTDQWERDIRRDALLATIGWQTLRFSHRRLTFEVPGCRRQTLQVLDARRRWRASR